MSHLKFFCLTSFISLAYVAELHAACSTAMLKGVYRYNMNIIVQGHQCHGSGRFLYDGNGGGWSDGSMVCKGAVKIINISAPYRYELNSNCTGRDWGANGAVDQFRVDSNSNIRMFFNDNNKRISGKANGKRIGNLTLADTRKIKNGLANWNRFASNNNQQNKPINEDNIDLSNQTSVSASVISTATQLSYLGTTAAGNCVRYNSYQAYLAYEEALYGLFKICGDYNYQEACSLGRQLSYYKQGLGWATLE